MADQPETLEDVIAAIRSGRLSCAIDPATLGIRLGIVDGLSKAAEKALQDYYRVQNLMVAITTQVAADWMESEAQAGRNPHLTPPDKLYAIIHERFVQLRADANNNTNVARFEAEKKSLAAQHEVEKRMMFAQFEAEKKALAEENQSLKNQLEAARIMAARADEKQSESAGESAGESGVRAEPEFFTRWKADKRFPRQSEVVRLMGESGLARSLEIRKRISAKLGIDSPYSSSINDILADMVSSGLAENFASVAGLSGRPAELLRLTDLGQTAYLLLTGQSAAPNEWTLKKYHKTDAHTLLNLTARDWLQKAGYTIVEDAPVLEAGGEKFNPDIAASKNGETLYFEVETQSDKGNQDTEAKWRRYASFTGGRMYVMCENSSAQNKVLREITNALGPVKIASAVIHLCNLSKMSDERLANFGLWAR